MANKINYQTIEDVLKEMPCPVCGMKPDKVGIGKHIFSATLICDHFEFHETLIKEQIKLAKEQLGI